MAQVATAVWVQSVAWELPHTLGAAKKKKVSQVHEKQGRTEKLADWRKLSDLGVEIRY